MAPVSVVWALIAALIIEARSSSTCPGALNVNGLGSIYPAVSQYNTPGKPAASVDVLGGTSVRAHMNGRAYFSDTCTESYFAREQYSAVNLLGKTLRYTVDLSGLGCGCNAALYLVSMPQNFEAGKCGDHYCDANKVCGVYCSEIDIQEANQYAFHATLHTAHDSSGKGGGYGGGPGDQWQGPRDFTAKQYSPGGTCIDTSRPFQVAASFPVDGAGVLSAMEVTLTQSGKTCPLTISISDYNVEKLGEALAAGMTPVVSYWAADDMLWLDGRGTDSNGGCSSDHKDACPETVLFSDFSVGQIGEEPVMIEPVPTTASPTPAPLVYTDVVEEPSPSPVPLGSMTDIQKQHVAEGCHTLTQSECCNYIDGRQNDFYGSHCVVVSDVRHPARDANLPCQPSKWVSGGTEWEGTVVGCPGDPAAASPSSGGLFGWLPNPFHFMMKFSSSSDGGAEHRSSGLALTSLGSLALIAVVAAALLFAQRLPRESRNAYQGPYAELGHPGQDAGDERFLDLQA